MSNGVAMKERERGRDRRPERHVQVAEAEALHLERVAGHAGETQVCARDGDALAVLVHVDRVEERVEVRLAVAVEVVEAAVVDLDAVAGDARGQVVR